MSDESKEPREESSEVGVPDDLPVLPSLSYNPRGYATENTDPVESSTPTYHLTTPGQVQPEYLPPTPELSPPTPEESGFSLLKTIGIGGMGEVWEAVQKSLWRIVAVKTIKGRGRGMSAGRIRSALEAFKGEARTSALLDHPNIVPIYDLGFDQHGIPQLAMKLVKGVSWDRQMAADHTKLDYDAFIMKHLQILVQVSQAVAFAHSRGVIHRDLKPGQVMIGSYGEVLLMDWGLALMIGDVPESPKHESPVNIYPTRDMVSNPSGTPGYMAPEQTEFTGARIGLWTDVYLLGGILYTVLTGRLPHPGKTSREAFRSAVQGIVTPFEESAPDHPPPADLKELAYKALSIDCATRPSAREFLEHLQDFLSGATNRRESEEITRAVASEPIERTYSAFVQVLSKLGNATRLWPGNPDAPRLIEWAVEGYAQLALKLGDLTLARAQAERLQDPSTRTLLLSQVDMALARVNRQRRRVKQFAAAVFMLLLTIIGGGLHYNRELTIANKIKDDQILVTTRAQESEARAKKSAQQESERATLLLADSLISQDRKDDAVGELLRIPEDKRYWEWGFVLTRALEDLWTIPFKYLEWSPSREYALGHSPEAGLCVLRAESGEVLKKLADGEPQGLVTAFSRDESRWFLGGANLVPTVMLAGTWETTAIENVTSGTLTAAEFSPDGNRIALGTDTGMIAIVNLTDSTVAYPAPHPGGIKSLLWGDRKMISASPGLVRRDDPSSLESRVLLSSQAIDIYYRTFNIKGDLARKYFAVAYLRERISYAKIDEGELEILQFPLNDFIIANKHPWLIASGGQFFPPLMVFDMEKREPVPVGNLGRFDVAALPGSSKPLAEVGELQLSLSETKLLHSVNGIVFRLVEFPSIDPLSPPAEIPDRDLRTVLMPNNEAAWVVGHDGRTHIRPLRSPLVGTSTPGSTSSFGPGDSYTSALREQWFEQRDVETGDIVFIGGRKYNWYMGGRTTTDGKTIFMPGRRVDKVMVEKADRQTGAILSTYYLNEPFADLEVFPDTARMALMSDDVTSVTMYSLAGDTLEEIFRKQIDGQATAMSFNGEGDRLVLATFEGNLETWDAATGRLDHRVKAHDGPVLLVSFARSRHQWATVGADRRVSMWGVDDLAPGPSLEYDFDVNGLAMSPDGKLLLAWPERGKAVLRDIETGDEISRLDRTDFPMYGVKFIDGGSRILASFQRKARFWDPASGRETFNIDEGFGEVSSDFKKLIYKTSEYDGTLIDIVPAREEDLPGVGLPYRDRLDLWMIERYKRWSVLRIRAQLPSYLDHLASMDGPVDDEQAGYAAAMLEGGASHPDLPPEAMRHAVLSLGRLWMSQTEERRWMIHGTDSAGIMGRAVQLFPEDVRGSLGCGIAIAGISRARFYETMGGRTEDSWIITNRTEALNLLALLYEFRGQTGLALQCARRSHAIRQISGFVPDALAAQLIERLGGQTPDPPAKELVLRQGSGAPTFVLDRMPTQTRAWTKEEQADALDKAWAEYKVRWAEYMDATPAPDWDRLIAEEKDSPNWAPFAPGTTFKTMAAELRSKAEPLIFNGRTVEEAREAEQRRVAALFQWKYAEKKSTQTSEAR